MNSEHDEWKDKLTPEQYHVLREKGTEAPFSGELNDEKREGMFVCAACGTPLFSSRDKYESGSGWPSFTKPAQEENVATHPDESMGMERTEVLCKKCGGHLGHVFDDGPTEHKGEPADGQRFCINSLALDFEEK